MEGLSSISVSFPSPSIAQSVRRSHRVSAVAVARHRTGGSSCPCMPPLGLPEGMGSLGWARCYWCHDLEYNMYYPTCYGGPLCDRCLIWATSEDCYWCGFFHWGMKRPLRLGERLCWWCEAKYYDPADNRPHRPHAIDRKAVALQKHHLLPSSCPDDITWVVAEFLVSKWKP